MNPEITLKKKEKEKGAHNPSWLSSLVTVKPAESPPPVRRSGAAKVAQKVAAWRVAPVISTQALQTLDRLLSERWPFQLLARSSGACVFASHLHTITAAGHSGSSAHCTSAFHDRLPGTHPPRSIINVCFFVYQYVVYIFLVPMYIKLFFFKYKSQLEYPSLKTDKALGFNGLLDKMEISSTWETRCESLHVSSGKCRAAASLGMYCHDIFYRRYVALQWITIAFMSLWLSVERRPTDIWGFA